MTAFSKEPLSNGRSESFVTKFSRSRKTAEMLLSNYRDHDWSAPLCRCLEDLCDVDQLCSFSHDLRCSHEVPDVAMLSGFASATLCRIFLSRYFLEIAAYPGVILLSVVLRGRIESAWFRCHQPCILSLTGIY